MRRSAAVAVLFVGITGAFAVTARSAVQPKVTQAEAVRRLGGMLGAKPEHVRLVIAHKRTAWLAAVGRGRYTLLDAGT